MKARVTFKAVQPKNLGIFCLPALCWELFSRPYAINEHTRQLKNGDHGYCGFGADFGMPFTWLGISWQELLLHCGHQRTVFGLMGNTGIMSFLVMQNSRCPKKIAWELGKIWVLS